jgi:hypothetical protein
MTRDDIIKLGKHAGFTDDDFASFTDLIVHFGLRVAAAERERMKYDGIHTCHAECQRPACVAVREAVEREREECAKVCDEYGQARYAAEAIRARGEK